MELLARLELSNLRDFHVYLDEISEHMENCQVCVVTNFVNENISDMLDFIMERNNSVSIYLLDPVAEIAHISDEISLFRCRGTIMTKGRILIRLSSLNARGCYILAIFLIGFGLLQITGINFLQDSHVPGIIESAACFVLLNLGYAVSSFYINKKPGLLSKLLTRAVIPSAIALPAFFLAPGSLFKIYVALFTVIFYISGYRSGITDDSSILGSRRIYIGVGIFAVFMILAKYHDYFHGYFNVLAGLAAFFCITAIIITNQKTLD